MAEDTPGGSLSGLSQNEAREFHAIFMTSFFIFTAIALVAHFLVWMWRPWLPSVDGYSMLDGATQHLATAMTYLA